MEIITGFTGIEHVTSADDASLYKGIIGQGDYVLDIGNKFEASIIDNNTIKVLDGDLLIQGHQGRIRANDYEEVTINNGTLGKKRHDLIVARYTKNTDTGVEKIELEVIQGESGDTAQDPSFVVGDISQGATISEFPLYRVELDGLSIVTVEKLFDTSKTLEDFDRHLADYVSKTERKAFSITPATGLARSSNWSYSINYIAFLHLHITKMDGSNFTATSSLSLGSLPHNIFGNMANITTAYYDSGGTFLSSEVGRIVWNGSVYAINVPSGTRNIYVSGVYLIRDY